MGAAVDMLSAEMALKTQLDAASHDFTCEPRLGQCAALTGAPIHGLQGCPQRPYAAFPRPQSTGLLEASPGRWWSSI
jgi:hypothetical protein